MAPKKKPEGELKDQRVPIMMSEAELQAIDDWSFKRRIRSRGEAIRRLCEIGIRSSETLPRLNRTFFEGMLEITRATKTLDSDVRDSDAERREDIALDLRILIGETFMKVAYEMFANMVFLKVGAQTESIEDMQALSCEIRELVNNPDLSDKVKFDILLETFARDSEAKGEKDD